MATTLEELRVIIEGEIAPFQKKMKEMEGQLKQAQSKVQSSTSKIKDTVSKQTSGIGAAFGKLAKIAGFAIIGKKMLDLGMYSTQMALEVSAAMNQIRRQMGESSQAFLKWIDNNANAMNMSVGEATKYGAVYSNLFSNFIKDSNKLSAYTGKMLQTSAVIAQGTGRTMTDVMERIRSGLLGNTEAIEDLGINVNVAMIESTEAFKRFANGQSWQQLDYNTQQQIRLMAILEQAAAKYGNTLQQSVNGRISLFKSLLSDAALNIGNALLPILNAIMPVLNSLAMALKNVTAKLAEFISLMFNKKATVKNGGAMGAVADSAKNAQDAVGGLGDAMGDVDDASGGTAGNLDDTAKAAKKAAKELLGLAGFDEITTLNLNKDDDGGGAGSGGGGKGKGKGGGGASPADILPEIALEDMDNQFKSIFDGWGAKLKPLLDCFAKLSNLFGKGFEGSFRADSIERFKNALDGIWQSLKDIFADGTVLQAAAQFGEKLAFALGQTAGAIGNVIMGIAVFIAESLNNSLNETKFDIKDWIIRQFEIKGDTFASIGNLAQAIGQIFYDTLTSIPATNIGADIISSFTYLYTGLEEINSKLERDMWAFWERLAVENQEGITTAFVGLLSAVEPIFESLKNLIRDTFKGINKLYDKHFKPFVDSFSKGFSRIFGTFLSSWNNDLQPALDDIGKRFSNMISEHIQPFVDDFLYLFGQVIDFLKEFWERALVPFFDWIVANILPVLVPIFRTLAEWFVEAWNVVFDVLGNIAEILGGLIEFIIGVFTGDWEKAWDGIVHIVEGIWDNLVSILVFAWEAIVSLCRGAWDTIVAIVIAAWEWILTQVQMAWNGIVRIFSPLAQWFSDIWNGVTSALSNIGSWFTQMFQSAWTGLTNIFKGLGQWFGDRWKDVTSILSNVASWFGNIFSQAFEAVKAAFSSIGSFFSGVWNTVKGIFVDAGQMVGSAVGGAFRGAVNAVLGTIENVVNGFVDMINGVLGVVNSLPGVSVGYVGGISLPRLARGGIVDSPTVAMIGEAGKEVVMPLENTGFLQTMGRVVGGAVVNALGGGLSQSSNWPGGDIIVQIGSREFGRFTIDEINKAQEEAGQLLLNI